MLQFKHPHDLQQLPEAHPHYPITKDLVARLIVDFPPGRPYAPEDDGWICLIEEQDIDRVITEIWSDWKLADVEWEGITYRDGFWQAVGDRDPHHCRDSDPGCGPLNFIPAFPWLQVEE